MYLLLSDHTITLPVQYADVISIDAPHKAPVPPAPHSLFQPCQGPNNQTDYSAQVPIIGNATQGKLNHARAGPANSVSTGQNASMRTVGRVYEELT